ncbi:esterase E4-like [Aricia agestis]|uniref:esterase E4-like n=1 Tax=Aricia agestis TaxID=91739 RepID=UPI001C207308|nr:esterase E4-like [Aricia agestis]
MYAINQLIRCPQMLTVLIGREDCLYLDVHVPEKGKKMPVIVYFHGGAFWHGGKDVYHPLLLNSNGVIVVAVNYRLGVLGFLCTNDVSNIGLRDQVAALKWVQQNIGAFGGDPDNVTICGQSAGGSLASMHLLSKTSSGLFHKAILMSGTAFSTWAFNLESDRTTKEDANKIASAITENDIYNVLEEAPLEKLMRATMGSSADPRYFRYTPCMDVNNTEPFFTDTPSNIIKSGNYNKVPVMIGYTDLEGMFFYAIIRSVTKDLNDNFVNHLPSVFSTPTKKFKRKIADKIRKHYFGNKTIDYNKSKLNLIRFYSDWIAYGATDAYSKLLAKASHSPVYNYVFSYIGDRNFGKDLSGVNLNKSTHSDDVFYMFKPAGINIRLSDRDAIFAYKYNTMIENFVKYGNPTPKITRYHPVSWPAATTNSSNVMVLDETFGVLEKARPQHRGGFFLEMLCDYGERGYVPCDEYTKGIKL